MCYNKIIKFSCGHHSEITRIECISDWSPAAYRCKASNLPTYIADPDEPSLCPSCFSEFQSEHFQKYMDELKEIDGQITKLEADYQEEEALHVSILTDLLNWRDADPRERMKEELKRHREENLAILKLLNYWTIYLRVAEGKRKTEMGIASSQDMISLEEGLAELEKLGTQ